MHVAPAVQRHLAEHGVWVERFKESLELDATVADLARHLEMAGYALLRAARELRATSTQPPKGT